MVIDGIAAMPLINLEDVIPHRDGMLLVGRILEVDEEKAVSESIATGKWPLVMEGFVNSLVTVELVATHGAAGMLGEKPDEPADITAVGVQRMIGKTLRAPQRVEPAEEEVSRAFGKPGHPRRCLGVRPIAPAPAVHF